MDSLLEDAADVEPLAVLSRFRVGFHACLTARADELSGLALPRAADGRLVLAADVSNWLRPGAATSPERLFCHVCGRGKGQAQLIPGWPYSVVAVLEPGRTSGSGARAVEPGGTALRRAQQITNSPPVSAWADSRSGPLTLHCKVE